MAKKRTQQKPAPESLNDSNVVYVTSYEVTDEPIYDQSFRRLPQPVKDEIELFMHLLQMQHRLFLQAGFAF